MSFMNQKIPKGKCQCGCGLDTDIATRDRTGYKKGERLLFRRGHIGKLNSIRIYKSKIKTLKDGTVVKLCTRCKKRKPISEFNRSATRSERMRAHCKKCERDQARLFYKSNPIPYRKRATKYRKEQCKIMKTELLRLKDRGCSNCGETEKCTLEFHHLYGNSKGKDGGMPVSRAANYSRSKFSKELEKCVLLCANCHKKAHAGIIKVTKLSKCYPSEMQIEFKQPTQ